MDFRYRCLQFMKNFAKFTENNLITDNRSSQPLETIFGPFKTRFIIVADYWTTNYPGQQLPIYDCHKLTHFNFAKK